MHRNSDWLTQNLSSLSMLSCQNSFHTHHSTHRWPVVMVAGTLEPDQAETRFLLSATLRGLSWGDIQPEPRVAENWQGACHCDWSAQSCICGLSAIMCEIFSNTSNSAFYLFHSLESPFKHSCFLFESYVGFSFVLFSCSGWIDRVQQWRGRVWPSGWKTVGISARHGRSRKHHEPCQSKKGWF